MPKQIYMENRSFRDILHQMLEPDADMKSENPPRETLQSAEFAPLFNWKAPEFRAKPKQGYSAPTSRKIPPPREEKPAASPKNESARPTSIEKNLSMNDLKAADQHHVRVLVQLGAEELEKGISLQRIKKAHRRLAKRLHPDAGGKREHFQLLQSAYEGLNRSLPSYITSVSACGNESASAEESQRRDAA